MTDPSSFRDSSGEVFYHKGSVYRRINTTYGENYQHVMRSGLYQELIKLDLLISHQEVSFKPQEQNNLFKTIKPLQIPFISYPYEWCFSQLKEAALTTLKIQQISLNYKMSLKDASAYNIQFFKGKPILIDTLSFERYIEGEPWVAYQQFCMHFLAPLLLMKYKDPQLNRLLQIHLDGIPLKLASKLLPAQSYLKRGEFLHIHLHSKAQDHFSDKVSATKNSQLSKRGFEGLIDDLLKTITKLSVPNESTEWSDYYTKNNYSKIAIKEKNRIIYNLVRQTKPRTIWDFGSNNGLYGRLFKSSQLQIISFDNDTQAIESNYDLCRKNNIQFHLPLLMDLTNPSPQIGWGNQERYSLTQRGPADTLLVLALIHHLVISKNIPLIKLAEWFSQICHNLIIEFIPKSDSQVKRLLLNRKDIFYNYNVEEFEKTFSRGFEILIKKPVKDSERIIYLMRRKQKATNDK